MFEFEVISELPEGIVQMGEMKRDEVATESVEPLLAEAMLIGEANRSGGQIQKGLRGVGE